MAPSAIDAKEAERSAAIADAKQKGNEAASLPRPSNRCRPVAFPAKGDTCVVSRTLWWQFLTPGLSTAFSLTKRSSTRVWGAKTRSACKFDVSGSLVKVLVSHARAIT